MIAWWVPHLYIMGVRDLQTWSLNKVRLRASDHFLMIVKIDGKDLRAKKRKAGQDGLQDLKTRKSSSKNSCSAPVNDERSNGLVALQERLEGAAVKAPRGYEEQEQVHGPRRDQGDGGRGGKMQGPGKKEVAAEEEGDAGRALLPGSKVVHRPVVAELWINGRAQRGQWQRKSEPTVKSATMTKW